ncbi:hypothetical protein [Streptomyces sp. NPDC002962]|uniref:hypothetical protein n=1 Tax=Streptomyces sp. NPDC002962 TaxID=3364674 RepID=UPI00369C706B
MTEYVSQAEMDKARSDITKEIEGAIKKHDPDVTKEIEGAIKKHDAEQEAQKPKWFNDLKGLTEWVPTEFNGIKSELTLLKSEFVPFNASLPSIFSLEELIKKRLNLDYNDWGVLTRQTGGGGGGGAQGARGPRGERGAQGPEGPRGREGREGRRGARGERGRPGRRGPRGEEGRQGRQGPAGPPPSTEALRNATRDARTAEEALRGVVDQADRLQTRLDGGS